MQLKTPFRDWAAAMQRRLDCEYGCSQSIIDHSVSIGTIRETVVRDILRAFLPASIEIGTGQIMDLKGNLSSQVDIVLSRADAPVFRFQGGLSAFMHETVLATVEVKSAGHEAKLGEALENCQSVKNLFFGINVHAKGRYIFDEAFRWVEQSGGLAKVEDMINAPSMARPLSCPDDIWFILVFVRFWLHWEAGSFRDHTILDKLGGSMVTGEFDFFSNLLANHLKADLPKALMVQFPDAPKIKEAFFQKLYEFLLYDQLVPNTFVFAYHGYKQVGDMVTAVKSWFAKNLENSSWADLPRVIINNRMFMYRHFNEYHCATHDSPVIFFIVGLLNVLAPEFSWRVAPGAVAQINRYFDIQTMLGKDHPIYGKDYLVWKIPFDDSSDGEIIRMNK